MRCWPVVLAASVVATLLGGLGDYRRAITSDSDRAQRFFDQGLMLTWGFNHQAAVRSSLQAASIDPECAMCWWGAALVLGPHVNAAMDPADNAPARDRRPAAPSEDPGSCLRALGPSAARLLISAIDKKRFQCSDQAMLEVETVEDPAAVAALMDPLRARLLAELSEPRSAAGLAERVGLPRQKVNYHLRMLEERGLARVAEERKWGGLTERRMVATAASYVVSPDALGPVASDTDRVADRLSASYLIAVAARAVREVGRLLRLARRERKRLATLSIDTEIDFATPADRAAFTRELGEAIAGLVARYHEPHASDGRLHRLVVFAHPFVERPR